MSTNETNPTAETSETDPIESAPLDQQLRDLQAERDEYLDKWTRARADLENYRKRAQKEAEEQRLYSMIPVVRALLPGLDNLDRAIKAAAVSHNVEELSKGVEMVAAQFQTVLSQLGVQPIEAVDKSFDPHLHEAIQQIPSDQPAGTVIDEMERGYQLHDRVIRPSRVILSGGPPAQPQ